MYSIIHLLRKKWLAAGWLILISILFCLPGSAFPRQSWLDGLHLDKWVHVGFFALLVLAWLLAFRLPAALLIGFALTYGILVEVVQHRWIANRSFDVWDVVADAAGIALGFYIWLRVKRLQGL